MRRGTRAAAATSLASVPALADDSHAEVAGDSPYQSALLEELSDAVRYRRWLVSLALPYLGARPLEIGSGNGDHAAELAALGVHITASEADPHRLRALQRRFATDQLVDVRALGVPTVERADYTAVVAYNVLEHIPDDVAALRAFGGLVRPGGAVMIFVPAFMVAFSRLDAQIGHQRRYRKRELAETCRTAGLQVERIHYVNSLGLLAWLVGMRLLRRPLRSGPLLRAWDRVVIPVLQRLESRRRPPFGQSLFVVARAASSASER
jgi:SAM-dependent methyltransferase